jgi:hypothetical protein
VCFLVSLLLIISSSDSLAQSEDKIFTEPKFGLGMKYPADWTFVPEEEDFSAGTFDYSTVTPPGFASLGDFCPTSYVGSNPKVLDCHGNPELQVPVYLSISVFKLKEGTTLKEFYDQITASFTKGPVANLVGTDKNIEIRNVKVSGLNGVQTISTHSGSGGSLGKLLKQIGKESPTSKDVKVYVVNSTSGYRFSGSTDDESDFDTYFPTIQKMINSIQIQGANENSDNTSIVAETTEPTDDVVLLSHRMKKGSGDYNDIIGQVKNIGSDTVEFVKIGLTVYDNNGDVVGTDSTYADSATLKPNQKSSFDIISTKDNFSGMKNYELSLQWRDSNGEDQYIDNAQIYRDNSTK